MHVFRCQICGDPYLGATRPSHCPFCGAHANFIVPVQDYRDFKDVSTDKSRANLEAALELEISNSQFYRSAAQVGDDEPTKQMFRALAKIEAEHASTICKWLGIDKPASIMEVGKANESMLENVQESRTREENASAFYAKAAGEAMEKGVAKFFRALVEIEKDHIKLDQQALARLAIQLA
ncbi:MAG: ferritin [Actinobacteria bacterium]|nr:MAG: ferritin [Actinomycetota bacterium]